MFSFFRRKSKDDGEKKEKCKDKGSFSPFSKRHDSVKKEASPSCSKPFSDCSLTVAAIDTHTLKNTSEDPTTSTDTDAYTHAMPPDPRDSFQTTPDTLTDTSTLSQDEQQHPLICGLQNIADSPRASPVIGEEDPARDGSERAGSSDRADSDIVFKTAPNTPLLVKHLTVVSDEAVVDSPVYSSEVLLVPKESISTNPSGVDLDFPSADCDKVDESENSAIDSDNIPETLEEVTEPEESEAEEKIELKKEQVMCEEMNHGPGELYDIAEEETSEEEEDQSEEEEEGEEEEEEDDDDDDDDSGNVTQPNNEDEYSEEIIKRNHANTRELAARLSASEAESNKLLCRIDDLQRDVMVKTGGMDRLQAELNAAYKESDFVKKRLKKLEEDLDAIRQKNAELTEELQRKTQEMKETEDGFDFNHLLQTEQQVKELTQRVKELEQRARTLEAERQEERRIIQEALDNAIAEKQSIQTKFEKDFERLRTLNTDREQQLLDDFEWKLREVNQVCKKRLEEKENSCKQRIKTMEEKLRAAEEQLTQLERLKQFEAEATQLRGLNLEQQRALRFAERAKEQLQVSEKVLQEEVKKLEESLEKEKAALTTMQAIHNREIEEKERKMRFRLEQQKTELNNQWEEKLRKETIRLKVELYQINRDEKRMVLQSARLEKEAELQKAKEQWEQQFKELQKEIESLKQKLLDSEEEHQSKIDNIRTTADRDVFDLRRKLDRIDISYQDKIEKLQKEHEKEKEEQWEQLMQERDELIAVIEEKHKANLEKMKAELEKMRNSKEQELAEMVARLQEEDCGKKSRIIDLTSQTESLQENIEELNKKLVSQEKHIQNAQEETDNKIKLLEDAHRRACQELTMAHQQEVDKWRTSANQLQLRITELNQALEQSKESKLVEDLRKALSEKEHQVAQLSKEKHLYQLELMNRNCDGEATTVTARQRKRGSRGKPNRPGSSRGQHK